MTTEEDISSKKLTLQGLNKLRLNFNFSTSAEISSTGATIVKKRKRGSFRSKEQDNSKLISLTEKEQIFRINAVQNATSLKEKSQKEKEEISINENINRETDSKNLNPAVLFKEAEEKALSFVKESNLLDEDIDDNNQKPLRVSKDIYSKYSTKMIIARSIEDKILEQSCFLKQKPIGIRKRSKPTKGKNISREVVIQDKISIKELSIRMAEDSKDVLKILQEEVYMNKGVNDFIDSDTACKVIEKFNHTAKRVNSSRIEDNLFLIEGREELCKKCKPPVVTFMGHVDHGKTSLLDAFRQSNVAKREPGGITQHIGAYQAITKNKQRITFIDTPGHEAFTAMRMCGANITDIVVIVIAADDGIMKQTIEAINHAKLANVPIIVAINKIDKSNSDNIKKIVNNLPQYGLIPEELGGDVMVIPISAKKKINLDKLEEAILLIADLMKLEAIESCRASGWVIESRVDKASGISATLIIKEGTLKIGDILLVDTTYGKVRSMINHTGQKERTALPSTPIEVTGLNSRPNSGSKFVVVNSEKQAREIIEYRFKKITKRNLENLSGSDSDVFSYHKNEREELSLILKCDVTGSIEAVLNVIYKLNNKDKIKLNILHKGVGRVSDSDILLAEASRAIILAFNVKIDSKIRDLAKQKGIKIYVHNIIYDITESIKISLARILKPITRMVRIGSVYVKQKFNMSKTGNVVGCYVSDGVVRKDSLIKAMRNGKLVYEGKLRALRRFKDNVKEVGSHLECGISLDSDANIKVGDIIEIYQIVQEEDSLFCEEKNQELKNSVRIT